MPGGYGHGAAVGDVDGDGRPDLLVTRWRSLALYRNRGDGTFEDATDAYGLGGDAGWPTSAAFADLDGDGDLDLYVCEYLHWNEQGDRTCIDPADPSRYACNPLDFPSLPDRAYRNEGGRFVDATDDYGIVDRHGRGLGVVAADLDGDRRVDLFVADDMTADLLFMNRGEGRFVEFGGPAGVAANAMGSYQAGMGAAVGDLDGDGRLDLAVTNYYDESTSFFRNLGDGFFADQTAAVGLAAPSRGLLGFGLALPDVNNDGRLDLLERQRPRPRRPAALPLEDARPAPARRRTRRPARRPRRPTGAPLARPHLGRGLAVGDLDNDGRLDAVLVAQDEPLVYLHNRTEPPGRFVSFLLEGTASNRDGVGAAVVVAAGGRRLTAARAGGGSYQSAGDPRLHFGLGGGLAPIASRSAGRRAGPTFTRGSTPIAATGSARATASPIPSTATRAAPPSGGPRTTRRRRDDDEHHTRREHPRERRPGARDRARRDRADRLDGPVPRLHRGRHVPRQLPRRARRHPGRAEAQ